VLHARHDLDLAPELHVHVRALHPLRSFIPEFKFVVFVRRLRVEEISRQLGGFTDLHGALDGDDGAVGEDALVDGAEAALPNVMRPPAEQQQEIVDECISSLPVLLSSLAGIRIQTYSERNWAAVERSCASHSIKKSMHQYIYCLYMYATTELWAAMVL